MSYWEGIPPRIFCVKLTAQRGFKSKGLFIRKYIWVFPKIGGPQNGRFIMEIPIKMDDLGVPPFSETPIYIYM